LSVTLPNDLELLWKFADQPGIVAAARSVGKLAFMRDGLPASCTGFMIAGELMVTNRHCIDSQSRCNTAMVLFGYEQGKQGALTVQDQQDCLEYIDTPELSALDVAVIRVTGSPGASDRFGRLLLRDDDLPSQPEALQEATAGMFVVSHPGGAAKMVTKGDCSITTPLAVGDVEQQESDFGHKCDVSDGSSGAPILDINGRVIGIHHLGFDNIGRWNKENRAVRVDAVRKVFMELLQ
jgi:S1-C subfamily serine protease